MCARFEVVRCFCACCGKELSEPFVFFGHYGLFTKKFGYEKEFALELSPLREALPSMPNAPSRSMIMGGNHLGAHCVDDALGRCDSLASAAALMLRWS